MKKDMFIHKYKWPDIIEDCEQFLIKMKKIKPYIIEFKKDDTIKMKDYFLDCIVEGKNC